MKTRSGEEAQVCVLPLRPAYQMATCSEKLIRTFLLRLSKNERGNTMTARATTMVARATIRNTILKLFLTAVTHTQQMSCGHIGGVSPTYILIRRQWLQERGKS